MAESGDPIVLVCGCCDGNPDISTVLKGLLHVDELPSPKCPCTDIEEYPWRIDNKYYDANVRVQHLTTFPAVVSPSVADSPVEALLITFDALKASSWENAKQWCSFAEERDLDIRLLLCDQVPAAAVNTEVDESQRDALATLDKDTAMQWCIQNGFELVEVNPADSESDDEEDEFGRELTGVERCVQVLNAHEWTNLIMKERDERNRQPRSPGGSGTDVESCKPSAAGGASLEDLERLHEEKAKENKERLQLNAESATAAAGEDGDEKAEFPYSPVVGSDEKDDDQFGQLFERFGAMKAQAETLEPGERKAYAEKVVMAFWQAMGGDGDELEGIDSDDQE